MPENASSPDWLNRLPAHAVFVIVAGFFGVVCGLLTPPMQVPDEQIHWYRVYQLSEGILLSPKLNGSNGGNVPVSILDATAKFSTFQTHPAARVSFKTIEEEFHRPLRPGNRAVASFPPTSLYSPLPYLPQTIAMLIGRLLEWPPIGLLYFARIGTVLGYLLIGSAAIRVMPILKWPACMILTCPVALFLTGSISADAITIAVVFLAVAMVLRSVLSPGKLSGIAIAQFFAVMIAVTLCKSVYFPIALLALAIPRDKWGTGKRRWLLPIGIILLSIAVVTGWSILTDASHVRELGDDPADQMQWIIHHPLDYGSILLHSLIEQAVAMGYSGIGVLGWLDTPMLPSVIQFYVICLMWITLAYDDPLALGLWPRAVAALALVATVAVIATSVYLVWNKIGRSPIQGLQGRYFLSVALLPCIVFRRRGRYPVQSKWMLALLSVFSLYTVWVLAERYYI